MKVVKNILWAVGFVMMILGVWQAGSNTGVAVALVVVGIAVFLTGLLLKKKPKEIETKEG